MDEMKEDLASTSSGFTKEEARRARELAEPFNSNFSDDSDHSMTLFAKWMDQGGFIFSVDDDLTGSTLETVHERDLEKFLADWLRPRTRTS